VGSALAYRSIPLQSAYCAAKHAILGFTQSLRTELLHDDSGVAVTIVEMPAMNTPQFDWVRSRLPHRAQPVPPIYQPEVGARAVVWAATHPRREVKVGVSTLEAVYGTKVIPGIADRYLARYGYVSQQTDQPEDPSRPDNLFAPVDGDADHGARGRFNDRAHDSSLQAWADTRGRWVALGGAALVGIAVVARAARSNGRALTGARKSKVESRE
jgi:hypothetical protein